MLTQESQFCIVLVGTIEKFHIGTYIGIEIQLICATLNIEMYLVILIVSGNISEFGRKKVIWSITEKEVK